MALTYVLDFPGATRQQYDQVLDRLQLGGKAPRGQIYHVAGPTTDGWCVVDVWESQEAFDRFIQEKLDRAMREVGMSFPQQPRVFPVHNILEPARTPVHH